MPAMSVSGFPSWLPASAGHVSEEVAQATLRKLQRCQVHMPLLQRSLQTVYIETAAATAAAIGKGRCSVCTHTSQLHACCARVPVLASAGLNTFVVAALDSTGIPAGAAMCCPLRVAHLCPAQLFYLASQFVARIACEPFQVGA